MSALHCEMSRVCTEPVTYVDEKGYVYCTDHGLARQASRRCRKLRPHERRRLQDGNPLTKY